MPAKSEADPTGAVNTLLAVVEQQGKQIDLLFAAVAEIGEAHAGSLVSLDKYAQRNPNVANIVAAARGKRAPAEPEPTVTTHDTKQRYAPVVTKGRRTVETFYPKRTNGNG